MVEFRSRRERVLWLCSSLVLAAIVAASISAGSLVEAWGTEAVLSAAFAAGLALAGVAVVGTAVSGRRARAIWVALGALSAIWMIPVRGGVGPLERTHLFEYGVLAVLIHEALDERRRHGAGPRRPALLAVLAGASVGWADEGVQAMVPGRVYDPRDVAANALAAAVAVGLVVLLRSRSAKD